jgi:hypothetical protein
MAEIDPWHEHHEKSCFLVTLDIAGFSRHLENPNQLLAHRTALFRALENTSLVKEAMQNHTLAVHFLGDELRLAFRDLVGAARVRRFLDDVQTNLDRTNTDIAPEWRTTVKGTVLAGVISWATWNSCIFIDGALPFKAQRWMEKLRAGQIAIDMGFKTALEVAGERTDHLPEHNCGEESPGYLLRGGQ